MFPGQLERMVTLRAETFDSEDFFTGQRLHGRKTAARCFAIDVNGAGATEAHTAAEFRASEFEKRRGDTRAVAFPDRLDNREIFPLTFRRIIIVVYRPQLIRRGDWFKLHGSTLGRLESRLQARMPAPRRELVQLGEEMAGSMGGKQGSRSVRLALPHCCRSLATKPVQPV